VSLLLAAKAMGTDLTPAQESAPFLVMCPWDVEVWFASDTYNGLPLDAQGAYFNLCMRAWQRQPFCALPDDDAKLWRLAGCSSVEQWKALREVVLGAGGWMLGERGWTHPTVTATYAESLDRQRRAVRAGRIAGKESARVRRELSKKQPHRTTVEQPFNDRQPRDRSTIVNPPSPSPSPTPTTNNRQRISALSRGDTSTKIPVVWSREACDDWIERYGGTAPGGQIGKAIKPLLDHHGWPAVRAAWRSYLAQVDAEYASPSRFASTYGRWSGSAPPGPTKPAAVVENNRAVLERFVKAGEGR
jgi:uncharacterized protein YdaU (DUF1376 family)